MRVIRARNVHTALPMALHKIRVEGIARNSRNGRVLQMPEPTATVYLNPTERVVFHSWRDANPFFHFYESLWMLAGRNDIAPLARYVKRMADYSDDGVTQNAAYGHRWRNAQGFSPEFISDSGEKCEWHPYETDQLKIIVDGLKKNKDDRQLVLQIWDHVRDLGTETKDHACNLMATFQVGVDGRLHMSVFCRSNDLVFGCYGANAVHFSVLLEYVARSAGLNVGTYTQISVNLHAYDSNAAALYQYGTKHEADVADPYELGPLYVYPLMSTDQESWDADCRNFVTDSGRLPESLSFNDRFFSDVAVPIVRAHDILKDDSDNPERFRLALSSLYLCRADDWRTACVEWVQRRAKRAVL